MVNFVIVDDNISYRKRISKIVVKSMMKNSSNFEIFEYSDFNKELVDYIKNDNKNTIYILDLELPSGDGIEIARTIRDKYNNWISPIIIITVHTSLAFEVYKQRLQVLDFIGKCEDIEDSLIDSINISIRMINKEDIYRYTYKSVNYSINMSSINYIKRSGRQIKIITNNGDYYQNISINQIKDLLPDYFTLSSKGVLINLRNIERIDWNEYKEFFKDGTSDYLVSKSHRKEIDNNEHK